MAKHVHTPPTSGARVPPVTTSNVIPFPTRSAGCGVSVADMNRIADAWIGKPAQQQAKPRRADAEQNALLRSLLREVREMADQGLFR